MKGKNVKNSNQIEFRLHGTGDEFDISPSPSPNHFPMVDDDIPSELLESESKPLLTGLIIGRSLDGESDDAQSQASEYSENSGSRSSQSFEDSSSQNSEELDSDEILDRMKDNLANHKELEESPLLNDLKAIKEEVWAKKKAKLLQKQMKKVQFQEPPPFCRACCAHKKLQEEQEEANKRLRTKKKLIENGCSTNGCKNNLRPVAPLHSINMFQNIIPKHLFPDLRNSRDFTPLTFRNNKIL